MAMTKDDMMNKKTNTKKIKQLVKRAIVQTHETISQIDDLTHEIRLYVDIHHFSDLNIKEMEEKVYYLLEILESLQEEV